MFGILSKDARIYIWSVTWNLFFSILLWTVHSLILRRWVTFNSLLHMNVLFSNTRYIIPWNLFLSPLAALLICALSNYVPFRCCLYVWNFNTSSWQMTELVHSLILSLQATFSCPWFQIFFVMHGTQDAWFVNLCIHLFSDGKLDSSCIKQTCCF